jgi:hypothetical protein
MPTGKKGRAMGKKKQKPINEDKFGELEGIVCYIADQVAFLEIIFNSGVTPKMEGNHFSGLGVVLNHIHEDTYKALSLIDEIQIQATG